VASCARLAGLCSPAELQGRETTASLNEGAVVNPVKREKGSSVLGAGPGCVFETGSHKCPFIISTLNQSLPHRALAVMATSSTVDGLPGSTYYASNQLREESELWSRLLEHVERITFVTKP
jgi:hypothetical protein